MKVIACILVVGWMSSTSAFAGNNTYGLPDEDYIWLVKIMGAMYVAHDCVSV
jgi:hypothetical protein